MGSRLPVISGREAIIAFEKIGFVLLPGRGKGDHKVMARQGWPAILTIPDHKEVRRGTLRSLIRSAGISVEEFVDLM
jgi:predicted RNA binding protein YcfA (HicA-like mRNA interferase family)